VIASLEIGASADSDPGAARGRNELRAVRSAVDLTALESASCLGLATGQGKADDPHTGAGDKTVQGRALLGYVNAQQAGKLQGKIRSTPPPTVVRAQGAGAALRRADARAPALRQSTCTLPLGERESRAGALASDSEGWTKGCGGRWRRTRGMAER